MPLCATSSEICSISFHQHVLKYSSPGSIFGTLTYSTCMYWGEKYNAILCGKTCAKYKLRRIEKRDPSGNPSLPLVKEHTISFPFPHVALFDNCTQYPILLPSYSSIRSIVAPLPLVSFTHYDCANNGLFLSSSFPQFTSLHSYSAPRSSVANIQYAPNRSPNP